MVDDLLLHGFCRWLGVSREVQPLWLIGGFSALLATRLGKFPNKLRYFPLVNIRAAASILSLHLQPPLFRWLHHPPCGLDLPLLFHRLCRLGQELTAQVIVQVFVSVIVLGEVPDTSGKLSCQFPIGFPSCLVIVKQTVYALITVQHVYGFGYIGNGIENNVILPVKVVHGRTVLHPQGEE